MISVEGVPHAEGVCRDAESDSHELTADREVLWCHQGNQYTPADDV